MRSMWKYWSAKQVVPVRIISAQDTVTAGAIHSDIERGFIRAEVIGYEDFIVAGSMARARETGKLRIEGKDYEVRDGDVLEFRFNV